MARTLEELREQLSSIEPNEATYAGINADEVPLLDQLLHDREAWVASRAVFALAKVADAKAVSLLGRAAADPRPEVRVAVAASVKELRPSVANEILLRLLGDPELGVRKFAVAAVSDTHSEPVREKLRDLETRDPAPHIRDLAKSRRRDLHRRGP